MIFGSRELTILLLSFSGYTLVVLNHFRFSFRKFRRLDSFVVLSDPDSSKTDHMKKSYVYVSQITCN